MRAFIMWHRPRTDVDADGYRQGLFRFFAALGAARPSGLISICSHWVEAPAPAPDQGAAFEDWYLLEDSAALDTINDAAIDRGCESSHDAAAAASRDEYTGLLRLRSGELRIEDAGAMYWLDKPADQAHLDFLAALEKSLAAHDYAIWTRQMGLSPTAEFCVLTADGEFMTLPGDLKARNQPRRLWNAAAG